ncbi:hypothetical protein B0H14DRAFT_3174539 [Mycena olivaceomarginata]|nr:hypothetical protein B0H14DRAFT_3174539 [Mycena olivaceomarginata]
MEPTILTTLNVTRVSFGGGSVQTTVNANLPLDTPFEKLATFIRPLIDPNITPEKYRITAGSRLAPSVTTGASTYTGDLKINVNEPLAQYYKDYRRHHGRASGAKSLSDSSIDDEAFNTKKKSIVREESSTITVGPARFKFNRTLRVPNNANRYALRPVSTLSLAVNVTRSRRMGCKTMSLGGKQPWLDGIVTEPGVVQQFVAMKLGYRYTVEEQLSDTMMGGIQIDVFPSIVGFATFYHGSSQRKLELALDKSPEQQARRTDRHDQHLITGVVCPVTPITHELYKAHHYPWFDLYDEHLPTVHHHDAFEGLSSITKLDTSPNGAQPQHSTRDTACVARPCGHSACSQCFGEGILGGCKCRVCKRKVDKYVTFDKPVPTVIQGGGSEGTWWEAEMQIEGVVSGARMLLRSCWMRTGCASCTAQRRVLFLPKGCAVVPCTSRSVQPTATSLPCTALLSC